MDQKGLKAAMIEMTNTTDKIKNYNAFDIKSKIFNQFWDQKPLYEVDLQHVMQMMQKKYLRT